MKLTKTKDYNQFCEMVGANIRFCRIAKKFTQTKVAVELDLTFQQMQKYEGGINCLNSYRLVQLATFFKVGVQDLVNPDFIANSLKPKKKLSLNAQDSYLEPKVIVGSLEKIKDQLKKDGIDPEETIATLKKAAKVKYDVKRKVVFDKNEEAKQRLKRKMLGDLSFDASRYDEFEDEYPPPLSQLEHDPKMRATYDAIIDARKKRH